MGLARPLLVLCAASLWATGAGATSTIVGFEGTSALGTFLGRIVYETGLVDQDDLPQGGRYEDPAGSLSLVLAGERYETAAGPLVVITRDDVPFSFPTPFPFGGGATAYLDQVVVLSSNNAPVGGSAITRIELGNDMFDGSLPNPWIPSDALPEGGTLAALLPGGDLRIDANGEVLLRGDITSAYVVPEPATAAQLVLGLAALAAARSHCGWKRRSGR